MEQHYLFTTYRGVYMTTFGKYLYLAFFLALFFLPSIWDYFNNGKWAILENFFLSIWITIFLFMVSLLLHKSKDSKEKYS